jgi:hypothetical protein
MLNHSRHESMLAGSMREELVVVLKDRERVTWGRTRRHLSEPCEVPDAQHDDLLVRIDVASKSIANLASESPPAERGGSRCGTSTSAIIRWGRCLCRRTCVSRKRYSPTSRAARTRVSVCGSRRHSVPYLTRYSSVVFVTGNGSGGTSIPRASHSGSQPSPGIHSMRRLPGMRSRTSALCRS